MNKIFQFITGGVSGLGDHLLDNSGLVSPQIAQQFGIPENEKALAHFNCAYKKKIILQGKIYVYADKICFYSHFNEKNLVGNEETILVFNFSEIQEIQKVKNLLKNSILFKLNDGQSYTFTSFIKRNIAFNFMNSLYQIRKDELLEEEIFKLQLKQIEEMDKIEKENLQKIEEEIKQVAEQEKREKEKFVQNHVKVSDEYKSDLSQFYSQKNKDDQNNFIEKISSLHGQLEQEKQQLQNSPSKSPNIIEEEESKEDFIQQNQNNQKNQEIENPLQLQKENQKTWKEYQTQLQKVFAPREKKAQEILDFHNKKEHKITWGNAQIFTDINVQEFYLLFFSNQEFQKYSVGTVYSNFFEFYQIECQKEYNIKITQIVPEPPLIYQSIYSDEKLQIASCPLTSTRSITYVHPLEKSIIMPDKINGLIKDKFYWVSDSHFILERVLSYNGVKMADSFEVRVIFDLVQKGDDIELTSGYYINFIKKSWFKGKIESEARKQYEISVKDLKNMFVEFTDHYKAQRQENKMMLSKLESSFIPPSKEELEQIKAQEEFEEELIKKEKEALKILEEQVKTQINTPNYKEIIDGSKVQLKFEKNESQNQQQYIKINQEEKQDQDEEFHILVRSKIQEQEEIYQKEQQLEDQINEQHVQNLDQNYVQQELQKIASQVKAANSACTIF
ncbi:hypothetical protein PPERSA_10133 [Pseudocohnilembus persalinus]|uniref:VASt domain-containing protein n=1 Tax=Pseudocohnilembus persalinus TaxID=266149 RepID=A0A0V0QZY0_PSEPJ|nr:hypothetical protein PPERSA_10133 [Pseudocohnilembus persalinus]|eukprot:KRX07849.1 hypothetical protein PPERSA_10133 [Pseudocohnilembus persalinus]